MISIAKKWVVIACFMWLCGSFHSLEGARLHLLLVGDINPSEHILKNATEKDLEAMRQEAQQIAHYGGFEFSEMCFIGDSVRGKHIIAECQNLSIERSDVVIFYFSGHGYTTARQKNDPWPNLSFSGDRRGVPLSRIAKIIRALKPHFALIFADCCNTVLSEEYAPLVLKSAKMLNADQLKRNYQKMFCNQTGCVIVAGSKKAQPSLATHAGSFCTRAFLHTIQEKMQGSEECVDWKAVLKLTSQNLQLKAQEYNRKQDLIFSIE